jgi:hypothetical protein
MNALVKPKPAVGQVYAWPDGSVLAIWRVEERGFRPNGYLDTDETPLIEWRILKGATYLGTLDELRARATAGDLLYTDNSAVVARLSAENERLRAALKSLTCLIDNWQNDQEVKDNAFWQAYEKALAAVEGDAA